MAKMRACACAYRARARAQEFFFSNPCICPPNVFSLHCFQQQTNKSMDKLHKFELCVVFTDRNGRSYDCFVPLLGPATFLSLDGSTSNQEIPFEMWVSNRLSKWFHDFFVTTGEVSIGVASCHDWVYASPSIVRSFDDLTKLGHRVISLIMREIF